MVSSIVNISIWPVGVIQIATIIPGQCGPGGNSGEDVLYIPQSSRNRASPLDGLVTYAGHSLQGGLTPLQSMDSMASIGRETKSACLPQNIRIELKDKGYKIFLEYSRKIILYFKTINLQTRENYWKDSCSIS